MEVKDEKEITIPSHGEFTQIQAAAYLGFSRDTIRKMQRKKQIPHRDYGNNRIRYPKDKLDAWKEKLTIHPESENGEH